MGLLDDAIREHLDLKRRHGASTEEVDRQEREVLGGARRAEHEDETPEPAAGRRRARGDARVPAGDAGARAALVRAAPAARLRLGQVDTCPTRSRPATAGSATPME